MNNKYWEEETYNGNVIFHLDYTPMWWVSHPIMRTIEIDYSGVDSMREFLEDMGFTKENMLNDNTLYT